MTSRLTRRRGSTSGGSGYQKCCFRFLRVALVSSFLWCVWYQFRFAPESFTGNNDDETSKIADAGLPDQMMQKAGARNILKEVHKGHSSMSSIPWMCTFREYPDRRYYYLNSQLDFLRDAEYIRGLPPVILDGLEDDDDVPTNGVGKICVNQSERGDDDQSDNDKTRKHRPFSDGTNPSILLLERLKNTQKQEQAYSSLYQSLHDQGATILASTCITNGQCSWNDTPEEKVQFQISDKQTPPTLRTVILALDAKMNTIQQTTLLLEKDAPWGSRSRRAQKARDGTFVKEIEPFDDARLFMNKGEVWISYREGKGFGYDKQVLNPVRFDILQDGTFQAHVKASETVVFCCGRNMAMVDGSPNGLRSLTWVDPVTMVDVDDSPAGNTQRRRLRDKDKKKRSDFHGTNGFMLWLPSTLEYLGIGHFHRPPGRDTSNYARHGHHYTHAFFTVSGEEPYRLTRVSREFVFRTKSRRHREAADMIQFASGMELISGEEGKLLITYGINDCEGASIYLEMAAVQELLIKVDEGQEVVDLMKKL